VPPEPLSAEERAEMSALARDLASVNANDTSAGISTGTEVPIGHAEGKREEEGTSVQRTQEIVWGDSSETTESATANTSGNRTGTSGSSSSSSSSSSSLVDEKEAQLFLRSRCLGRSELLELLEDLPVALELSAQSRHDGRVCAAMLGYPNVGKSSVINTLLGAARSSHGVVRVGVSSTPGKTKHFQVYTHIANSK
jgi:hypothetical protein